MNAEVARYDRELHHDPALVERILHKLPAAQTEPERIIRCSREHVDRAICRALARAAMLGEVWRVEVEKS